MRSDGRTDPFTDRIIDDAARKPSGEKDGESALFLGGRLLVKEHAKSGKNGKTGALRRFARYGRCLKRLDHIQ
jgi:hypothetical protein